jgi:Ca2+-binding EF-hand superfamily protein
MRKTVLSLALAAFAVPALVSAATFEEVDTDADGVISMEEAMAAMPDMDEAALQAADADGDGSLSVEEFEAIPQG